MPRSPAVEYHRRSASPRLRRPSDDRVLRDSPVARRPRLQPGLGERPIQHEGDDRRLDRCLDHPSAFAGRMRGGAQLLASVGRRLDRVLFRTRDRAFLGFLCFAFLLLTAKISTSVFAAALPLLLTTATHSRPDGKMPSHLLRRSFTLSEGVLLAWSW